mmetsp:Transcript_4377/g.10896  ORF Transcript_4377/g.10896 Transcript_4377/m.10896 type:complete len:448 (-) Transcript_4377:270-1613(-)
MQAQQRQPSRDHHGAKEPFTPLHGATTPCIRRASSRVSDVDHDEGAPTISTRLKSSLGGADANAAAAPSLMVADNDEPATCIICFDEFSRRRPAHRIPCACQEGHIDNRASVHHGCIRAWAAQKSSCPLCRAELTVSCVRYDVGPGFDLRNFVTRPLALDAGTVQCSVHERPQVAGPPVYELFLDATSLMSAPVHILTGRWTQSSQFVIEISTTGHQLPGTPLAVGRGNVLGTRWTVNKAQASRGAFSAPSMSSTAQQHGGDSADGRRHLGQIAPGATATAAPLARRAVWCRPSATTREQLLCVNYKPNRFSLNAGPRTMAIAAPAVTEEGELELGRLPTDEEGVLDSALDGKCSRAGAASVYTFRNRSPVWDERYEAYVLNFFGRVRVASVKNFQLTQDDNLASETSMQFGRVSSSSFSMDVQWPFSVVQAFGIALTSIAPKLAVK